MLSPIDMRGLSAEYGSWKTICMLRRSVFRRGPVSVCTSTPSNATVPASGSVRPRMRRAVVDLPQPDSPTMPSVVPASTVNETLSTAETYAFEYSPVRTGNLLRSPCTLSSTCDRVSVSGACVAQPVRGGVDAAVSPLGPVCIVIASSSRWLGVLDVERVAEGVAHHVAGHGCGEDKEAGQRGHPRLHVDRAAQAVEHEAPFWHRRARPHAEEAQAGGNDDAESDQPGGVHENRVEDVREHLRHQDARRARPAQAGRVDVFEEDDAPRCGLGHTGDRWDEHYADREHRVLRARSERRRDGDREHDRGERVEHVHRAHQDGADGASQVAGGGADGRANDRRDDDRQHTSEQRQPTAVEQTREHITSLLVGAEEMAGAADGQQTARGVADQRVVRAEQRRDHRRDGQQDERADRAHSSAVVEEARAHLGQVRAWCDRVRVRRGGDGGWGLYNGGHRRLLLLFASQRLDQAALRNRGSISSCSTSTSRFMSTNVTATTSTPACSTLKSRAAIAWKINCPRPGHEKIVSTST